MTREQILKEITNLLNSNFAVTSPVTEETDLMTDLSFDTLDVVEFTMDLEESVECTILDEILDGKTKIKDFIDLLIQLQGN